MLLFCESNVWSLYNEQMCFVLFQLFRLVMKKRRLVLVHTVADVRVLCWQNVCFSSQNDRAAYYQDKEEKSQLHRLIVKLLLLLLLCILMVSPKDTGRKD